MTLVIPPVVSDQAFARLAEINAGRDEPQCLRVAVKGGGCSGFQYEMTFDEPSDDDTVFEKNSQKVLVDSVSMPFLENAVIDFSEELIGARFVINNPNAKSTCGCSMSFSI